ncbi:sigma factor regulatory protein, FecR/PupR family [Leptospira inadai serovar Lyme str. 10]|uniref:Sigma factor regulatory protein, FecR/PupR family n=2 Tax=Leptospira inadai serovar Lyme TaxID=293084 RepID=V6I0F7_9LEPT|nr:FecR family protein [Leptospira inadai]EQA38754.1 sigma factor regulatory protein, FecR/PupR family [Leptospira inadai serovar Lyme str. 10]PNV75213.1 iron dicitrate transport regulator FecR [Leptospira inadai serovar Lyme]
MNRLAKILSITLTLFAVIYGCKPKSEGTSQGIVTFLTGKVTVGKSGKDLKLDDAVSEHDTIVTAKDGLVDLTTPLGTIRLLGSTEASVAALKADQAYLKVNEGNILVKVVKLSKNQSISVDTPAVVAAVRGTQFWGQVNRSAETGTFAVREGSVLITRKTDEARVLVKAGEAVDLKPGLSPLVTRTAAEAELSAMQQIDQMK